MASYTDRVREFMRVETNALLAKAERARVLDHNTNKGNEAEAAIRSWLSARLAPAYTASTGEIIDSFNTNAERDSRQIDIIVHANDPDTNRFIFPSGQRLVPVESVAAVVEVKLTLSQKVFNAADEVAHELSELRVRTVVPLGSARTEPPWSAFSGAELSHGIGIGDPRLGGYAGPDHSQRRVAPVFALFGFFRPATVDTLGSWMRDAKAITVATSLSCGTVERGRDRAQQEHALGFFALLMQRAVETHSATRRRFGYRFHYGDTGVAPWR